MEVIDVEVEDVFIPREYTYEELQNHLGGYSNDQIQQFFQNKQINIHSEWRAKIEFLDSLRVMNKFCSCLISTYLEEYGAFIQDSLLNLRSQIQKLANVFVQELFNYHQTDKKLTETFLNQIIPTIFLCSTSAKQFIKSQAMIIIQLIQDFPLNNAIIENLSELIDHKSIKICELSSQILTNIFEKQKKKFQKNKTFNLKVIKIILKLNKGIRPVLQKNAKKITQILNEVMGPKKFQELISKNLEQEDQTRINLLNNTQKEKENNKKHNLQELIQQRRNEQK